MARRSLSAREAETDLAKNLVGKWQGEILLPGAGGRDGPYRTLVIKSVREQHLVGSFRPAGAGRREYSMKLEKVE